VQGLGPVPHTVTGTPHYMSPEQAHGAAQLDGRTDQYALGVLLYQCLTGRLPYESPSLLELIHMIDLGTFRPLRELRDDVPPALEQAVHRAMARHPRDRFPSMGAFGRALLPFASERTRVTYDRDFVDVPTLVANQQLDTALSAHYVSAATPLGDPFARQDTERPPTASGVRIRESQRPVVPAEPTQRVQTDSKKLTYLVSAFVVMAFVFALLAAVLLHRQNAPVAAPVPPAPHSFDVSLGVRPQSAAIELDGLLVGHGRYTGTLAKDGREHALRISAEGHEPRTLTFRDQPPPQAFVELRALAPVPPVEVLPVEPERAEPARAKAAKRRVRDDKAPAEKAPDDIQLSR
jgi:hypothetical protein